MTRLFTIICLLSTLSFHTLLSAHAEKKLHLGFAGNIQVSPYGLASFVEQYLNANLNEVRTLAQMIEIDDIQLYTRDQSSGLLPGMSIDLQKIKISELDIGKAQVKCFTRDCLVSLPINQLVINATIVVNYLNTRAKFETCFGLTGNTDLTSWVHLNISLNTENNHDSLLIIDPKKSQISLADPQSFFFKIENKKNGYHFSNLLLNQELLSNLVEGSINEYAITPTAKALSTLLNNNETLRYILENFISLSLPNIDLNGQIDFTSNEKIQSKIREMLNDFKSNPNRKTKDDLFKYVKKYRRYIENNNIYSYYVICFLNEVRDEINHNFNEDLSAVGDEIEAISNKANENFEKSKRNTFLKLELRRDQQKSNLISQPYAMSLFLLGNDNEPPGFRDIIRHGKLYSADEHYVIGGLLNILKLIKLNERKVIPKAKSEETVRLLHSYHVEWRKISKSLKKTSSAEFSDYVLSLLNAIRNHIIYFEKSSHAPTVLASVMMLSSFFKELNLKSSHEEADSFHARFILPLRFFNRYMSYLYESNQFENIQVDLKEKDILIENARDLIIKFDSAPVIKWDTVNSKFLISIKEVSVSLLVSNTVRYKSHMNIDFHFVPDINSDGEIYFRFHKLSSDLAFLPKREDKFVDKVFSMISIWTILPHATKLTVIRHIAYTQIKHFLTNLHFPLPNLYIGGGLNLHPTLNSIKYNQDHVFLELKLNEVFKAG